jgi:hypothetical protein
MLRLAAALAFVTSCTTTPSPGPTTIGLADVSVLLPLPASDADPSTLRLDTPGNGGALLPKAMFDAIPVFADNPLPERAYANWRIVSARIDPCFPDLALLVTNPAACRRQLRLVAQPIVPIEGDGPVGFSDNAIHLLYDLSEPEFTAMATRWLAVRSTDPTAPLGVHPTIRTQGLAGAVATELRATIAAYAGAATLSQFTFLEGRGVAWEFGGFKLAGGALQPIAIHGADATSQVTTSDETGQFGITPPSPEASGLEPLRGERVPDGSIGGGTVVLTADPAAIHTAMQLTLDVDNPAKQFNPDTLDCASCHVASRARSRATGLGATTDGLAAFTADGFDLELVLSTGLQSSPQQQRAFGYNGDQAVWNQRTVNESAAVAAYFQSTGAY